MPDIKSLIKNSIYRCFRLLPLKKDETLFYSYYGAQYSGSPKYLSMYFEKQKGEHPVWAFTEPQNHAGYNGKSVRFGSIGYLYHLAVAGTVVTNYRMADCFLRRQNQVYLQTWHSALRIKMIEKDAQETLPSHYIDMAKKDSKQISHLVTGSAASRRIFEQSFWYNGEIYNTGTPQCDVLFEDREKYLQMVHRYFNLDRNCKIALYAPTFRKGADLDVYDLDFEQLRDTLSRRFGGEWIILVRLHPHLLNKTDGLQYNSHVLQATEYDDVQELLCAAELLITDYSAVMFDYILTGRPCFLYTPDLENYMKKDRKFYFRIEELPFAYAKTQEDLASLILEFDQEQYQQKVQEFMADIESYDDGRACERIYNILRGNEN